MSANTTEPGYWFYSGGQWHWIEPRGVYPDPPKRHSVCGMSFERPYPFAPKRVPTTVCLLCNKAFKKRTSAPELRGPSRSFLKDEGHNAP